jgi:mRNA interferase YafQ
VLTLSTTSKFRKDYKRAKKRRLNITLLESVITNLLKEKPLDLKHQDHPLAGKYTGYRECHVQPDWLLVYAVDTERLVLTASRTGTHSDLF